MHCRKIIVSAILASLISVFNLGNLMAAPHGGMGGSFHGGMSMGSSFHSGMSSGMSSGMRSFAAPSFNNGSHNFSYSPQHFSTAPHVNGNFTSHIPSNSFNNSFHAQQFNYRNNPAFENSAITHGGNFRMRGLGNINEHFQSSIQHPVNPQTWNHNNNWWRNNFAFNHGHDHDHDFDHFHHSFIFSPFVFPFWWDYGPFYSRYGYPYYSDYYYGYTPTGYYYNYEPDAYSSTVPAVESAYSPVPDQYPGGEEGTAGTTDDWGDKYLSSARDAFLSGSYSDALRLANHAVVETPKNAKAHELMSLALFALKDYKGANIEAHAALSFGTPSDWSTLYGYYNDLPTYTKQLEALVDYIQNHKDAMDARFVLSYQDIMMGHKDAAKSQLEDVVAKIPKDQVAVRLLKELGGTPAALKNPVQGVSPEKHSDSVGEIK
jgi:hypothetical protein